MLIIVFGLPGSGKSFFAHKLCENIHCTYIGSDEIRNNFFQEKDYSESGKSKVYNKMLELSVKAFQDIHPVIVDATFYLEKHRSMFIRKAEELKKTIFFIEVKTERKLIKERTGKKRKDSDADFKVSQDIEKQFEPMIEKHLVLESKKDNVSDMILKALSYFSS